MVHVKTLTRRSKLLKNETPLQNKATKLSQVFASHRKFSGKCTQARDGIFISVLSYILAFRLGKFLPQDSSLLEKTFLRGETRGSKAEKNQGITF